ncbi:MAG: right-handed parallel beta-helix repeat-containing protein [Desulfovibrionaceae bacterium]|nr:right-handed parallel beta-helix repeat-containing protein [Desulfovibrionaceae bacterium]
MNYPNIDRLLEQSNSIPVQRQLQQILKKRGISLSDVTFRDSAVTSVRSFGAIGDGMKDDTKALQAAISASEGKILCFPQGRYKISDTLYPKSDQVYLALGKVSIQRSNTKFMFWLLPDKNRIAKNSYFGIKNIKFIDIEFDNNGRQVRGGETFTMGYADNIQFYNCTFLNNRGTHAVEISGSRNIFFSRCSFLGCIENKVEGREIIQVEYTTTKNAAASAANPTNNLADFQNLIIHSENIRLENCHFGPSSSFPAGTRAIGNHYSNRPIFSPNKLIIKNCTFDGLALGAIRSFIMKDVVITGSKFTNIPSALSLNRGTNKVSNTNILFKNNYIEAVTSDDIYPIYSENDKDYGNVHSNIQIIDNVFTGSYIDKYISLANCKDLRIENNKFIGNSNTLIDVSKSSNIVIQRNTANGTVGYKRDAIQVRDSSNSNVRNNRLLVR